MVAIGNSAANRFWEHHLQQEKLDAEVERCVYVCVPLYIVYYVYQKLDLVPT